MMSFDAYFLRHAESAGNTGLATDDPSTIPLTKRGQQQAEALAASLPFVPATIAASPFERAQETAKPLRARFPSAHLVTLPIQEFTYLAPTAWRGTTGAQRRPAVDAYWQRGDHTFCDGGGAESFAAFFARVEDCFQWLHRQPAQPTVLVCHELFIRGVIWRCFSPSLERAISTMKPFRAWQLSTPLPNVSTTRVTCSQHGSVTITPPFTLATGTPNEHAT